MKQIILILLCTCLVLSCFNAVAQEPQATAELIVTEADSEGIVTVSLIVKNAEFQVVQGSFYYNPEQFSLSEENLENMTMGNPVGASIENSLLSVIKRTNDSESGVFTLVAMSNLGYHYPDKYMGEGYKILADENGIEIFSVKLEKIGTGDYDIRFANEKSGVFDEVNPSGVALAVSGEELSVKTIVKLPNQQEIVEIFVPEVAEPDKTDEQLRKERMENSLILQINNYAATDDGELCWIDDENKAVMPYIKNSRTMIPLRFVAERLGLEVKWEGETQKIIMTGDETELVMQIGNKTYTKNGQETEMEAAPELTGADRTFVPLRAVAEAFGQNVHWDEKQSCVIIVPADKPWDETSKIEQRLLQDALLIMSPLIRDLK